jgi:hypothetical protein
MRQLKVLPRTWREIRRQRIKSTLLAIITINIVFTVPVRASATATSMQDMRRPNEGKWSKAKKALAAEQEPNHHDHTKPEKRGMFSAQWELHHHCRALSARGDRSLSRRAGGGMQLRNGDLVITDQVQAPDPHGTWRLKHKVWDRHNWG